jgi:DNA-directed RNA polymerase specialized sigma24 family protein
MDTRNPSPWTDAGQDPELLRRAQGGDVAALLRIYNTHRLPLWRTCMVLTRHQGEAERLYQDTIAHATRELATAPADQPLLPWLVRLARERDAERASARPGAGALRPNGQPWSEGAASTHDLRHDLQALQGFTLLHADDQWLLALRLFERLSYADISQVTGYTADQVAERIAIARDYVDQVCAVEDRAA